ncbi:SCO2584 family spore wall biosynthesis protein [Streptomyces cellostaticus]|uniref:SCO2584 family spore wall biosynthesis protein n=1 Tax=Streptomyces cellostaticus TaxID=67285 RepID=UPI002026AF88|nr:hypothetical protein [Streptomyces cellostaticus]
MPEDVGGTPFPDGWEPDDDHDRGVSDEEFASVVFDEAFVRAAVVHEPSAVERLLAAARARAEASEAEARRAHAGGDRYDDAYGPEGTGFGHDQDDDEFDDDRSRDDHHGASWPCGGQIRWHRPVAWVLALVMGVGMVALAFAAVYRGASSGTRDRMPSPASTGLEQGAEGRPSAPSDTAPPAVPVVPRSP